jgi:hypothetical protein
MPNFAELMKRLVELQSCKTQRSSKLIAEDERLMDRLQKRSLGRKAPHTVKLSPHGPVKERRRA